MTIERILAVGTNKDGDFDFEVAATIQNLSYQQMTEFRAMLMVSIGIAEDMWRRSRESQSAAKSLTN